MENPKAGTKDSIQVLVDTIASVNQIHGVYVGFSGEITAQYRHFETLTRLSDCGDLLNLCNDENPVVRGYAFWGLARKQYPNLDSVLLSHARDEAIIYEIQGGVISQLPLIDFMQWVVDPDILDVESKKLGHETMRRVAKLRFSEH
jgi:hypothetical protein